MKATFIVTAPDDLNSELVRIDDAKKPRYIEHHASITSRGNKEVASSVQSVRPQNKVIAIDTRKAPSSGPRLLYDRKEAARQLSISIRSLDYLIAGKTFRTIRVGKKVMIPHGELVRFASSNHYGHMASAS